MKNKKPLVIFILLLSIFLVSCPELDLTAPTEVSELTASSVNGQVVLSWTDPEDVDFDHVELTCDPGDMELPAVEAGIQTCTVTEISRETAYAFTLKTVDAAGNKSPGQSTAAIV